MRHGGVEAGHGGACSVGHTTGNIAVVDLRTLETILAHSFRGHQVWYRERRRTPMESSGCAHEYTPRLFAVNG